MTSKYPYLLYKVQKIWVTSESHCKYHNFDMGAYWYSDDYFWLSNDLDYRVPQGSQKNNLCMPAKIYQSSHNSFWQKIILLAPTHSKIRVVQIAFQFSIFLFFFIMGYLEYKAMVDIIVAVILGQISKFWQDFGTILKI